MNFQTILKGRTTQTLVLVGALALAGAGHAQSYGSEDRGSESSSGSTSGQMPKDDYHRNVKDKDAHKDKDAQREKLERNVEGAKKRDDAQKLDPGKYVPGSPANK